MKGLLPYPFILVLLSGLVYVNTLGHPFVWDDKVFISPNAHFQSILYIPEYFTGGFCKGVEQECPFYRPVVSLSYLMDYMIWRDNPFGFHLTNILLHGMVVLLFYCVVLKIFKRPRAALIASLFFSLHPIHVESVASIANRTDPPTAVFMLVSFYFFAKHLMGFKRSLSIPITLSVFAFGGALLTKELAVVLPIILLLYDLLFIRPWKGPMDLIQRWKTYFPFGLVLLGYFILRQEALGYSLTQDLQWGELGMRVISAPAIIWDYFRLHVFPYPLMVFHGNPQLWGSQVAAKIFGWFFLSVYLFIIFRWGRFSKEVLFGGLWFLGALLPVLNIIPIAWPMASERFAYIPSLGFSLAVGFLGAHILESDQGFLAIGKKGFKIGFLFIGIFLAVGTVLRNPVWGDELTLWKDTVQKAPQFAMGYMNLGNTYLDRGKLEEAKEAYDKALEYMVPTPILLHNLGTLYQDLGEPQKAEKIYFRLIEQNLAYPDTYYNLGLLIEEEDIDRAVFYYQEALALNPKHYRSLVRLGKVLFQLGKEKEALAVYQEAIGYYASQAEAYFHMGHLLRSKGKLGEAEAAFNRYSTLASSEEKRSKEFEEAQNFLIKIRGDLEKK